jgi:hypothetical protein
MMAEDIEITPEQLPQKAQNIISKAFPDTKIKKANIERRASLIQYEVKLAGGVKLQFRKDGSLTECECTKHPVPDMLIPAKIRTFIKKEFPDNDIMRIEHDSKLYELNLDDGTELSFNSSYRLVDIDRVENK